MARKVAKECGITQSVVQQFVDGLAKIKIAPLCLPTAVPFVNPTCRLRRDWLFSRERRRRSQNSFVSRRRKDEWVSLYMISREPNDIPYDVARACIEASNI